MKPKLPTIPTRTINHSKAGAMIRELRQKSKLSLRKFAAAMGYTPPFVSDLELGKRNWTSEKFQKAVSILSK